MIVVMGLFFLIVLPPLLALWLRARRPDWSRWFIVVISAAILPVLIVMPILLIVVDVMGSTKEQCGIDACGMALMEAMMLSGAAALAFAVGLLLSGLAVVFVRSQTPDAIAGVFE